MVRWLAVGLAAAVVAFAIRFGTFAAGGSDSYCYVEQAERWASGTMTSPVAPGESFPWRNVPLSLAPTGFIPSPVHRGAIAPICPAGLSLAMAVPLALGLPRASVFYVVPLCAGLAVWSVFAVGRRLAPDWAALLGAGVAAATPVFVFQVLQPMSDVPAAALWALALALVGRSRRLTFCSGLAAGAAVLVRPNLAPLAGIIGLYLVVRTARSAAPADARPVGLADAEPLAPRPRRTAWAQWGQAIADAAAFSLGVVPGVVGVAWVNDVLYGSPLSSGYGSLEELFSWANAWANLWRYPSWAATTASPLLALALAAPAVARDRGYAWLLLAFVGGVVALYLPYVVFDNWTYLRFLLPGLLPAFSLAIAVIACAAAARLGPMAAVGATVLAAAAWGAWQVHRGDTLDLLTRAREEHRFIVTGRFAGDALPPDALVFTIWQSGSVRYYGNRLTVVWDAIAPTELDPAIDALSARSRDAVLVLDAFEHEMFKGRFAGASRFAGLDWPPLARIGSATTAVTVWRFADRARYESGARLDTLLVR